MRFSARLDMLANLFLIVASLLVCVTLGVRLWSDQRRVAPLSAPGYVDGDVLPQVEGFRYSDAPKTLLLFVSTQCRFCTESMPFYKRLSTGKGRGTFQFVVVGAEPVNTLREYIGDFAVEPDRIITVSRGLFEVSATPTAIVADGTGRVRGYWRGLLRDRERELEAALRQ